LVAVFSSPALFLSQIAFAWGDEGHQAIALIASKYLNDTTKAKIDTLLSTDSEPFQMRDGRMTNASFATQATWADYYRTSTGQHGPTYQKTHQWHFVDIEINGGTLDTTCPNYPNLSPGTPAFDGAADDCVVNKIRQFTDELMSNDTPQMEKLRALKMLMHFVGDVHQPLHASDDHDAGGNGKNVTAQGMKAGKLHGYWDNEFVQLIGSTPEAIADKLTEKITKTQIQQWPAADPAIWANESYALAKKIAYGELPEPVTGRNGKSMSYHLNQDYINDAQNTVEGQLSKAGIRLAAVLNTVFR